MRHPNHRPFEYQYFDSHSQPVDQHAKNKIFPCDSQKEQSYQ